MKVIDVQFVRLTVSDALHRHRLYPASYEFHACTAGRGSFRCDESETPFHPGVVKLAGPGELHGVVVPGGRAAHVSFYYVQFLPSAREAARAVRLAERFKAAERVAFPPYVPAYLEAMKGHLETGKTGREHAAGMLDVLIDEFTLEHPRGPGLNPAVEAAIAQMRKTLGEPLNVPELAGRLDLNPSYFNRLFKQETGLPPLRYFTKMRIHTARYLLSSSTLAIAEIALRMGFCDEFHFSRTFRQFVGVPPGQYRSEHGEIGGSRQGRRQAGRHATHATPATA